jgi:hypothetical protein
MRHARGQARLRVMTREAWLNSVMNPTAAHRPQVVSSVWPIGADEVEDEESLRLV